MSDEFDAVEPDTPKPGKAGRIFITLVTLVAVIATAVLIFMRNSDLVINLLEKDAWISKIVGNFHPLILHLPIGVVFVVTVAETLGWLSFGRWKPVLTLSLFLGVMSGCLACVTGLADMYHDYGLNNQTWLNHMWFGLGFVSLLMVAFFLKIWGINANGRGPVYAFFLFVAAGVMGQGAHIGGEEVHGPLFPKRVAEEEADPEISAAVLAKEPKDRLAFNEVVMPIIDAKCVRCHDEDVSKGGLVMTSFDALLEGGEGGEDGDSETLVPGDAENSMMVTFLYLPNEDDWHMPPYKKKRPEQQLEQHEKDLIKWYVNALPAEAEEDPGLTMAEMGATPEVLEMITMLVSPEERAKMAEEKKRKEQEAEAAELAKKEALEGEYQRLKEDAELKNAINYVSRDSSALDFTAVSLRKNMTDDHLRRLAPVASGLQSVNLAATSVTESALKDVLPEMKDLQRLNLSQTEVGDELIPVLAQLPNLEWLNLYGTQVTDEGIQELSKLPNLQKLYLWNSKATPEGADELKRKAPKLQTFFGVN